MNIQKYFKEIEGKVKVCYDVAGEARKKGLDPKDKVEIPIATSLAERVVGLISTVYPQINDKRIVSRILELEKEHGQLDAAISFRIAEEVAKEKYCKFASLLQAIEAGIRLGFAYNTLGVVSSPIEGFTELKLGETKEGKQYFIPYFSGPIRSAGTTAACMALILIDYLREIFGYAKYDPHEKEIKRYITEIYDYHERVTNLQYLPTEEEINFLARNLPIQIAGDPTESREVSNYKDLRRVDSDFIRGGMCLIFGEGLAQKAQKGLRVLRGLQKKGFKISDWEFLEEYVALHKKRGEGSSDSSPTYIKDLVAGRPVFGHPSKSGSFRFRYGRSRVSGFSATSIHPATMKISDNFLSSGTQLKIEKPTKGCVVSVCDDIDGPIVKIKNGDVKKIQSFEESKEIYKDVKEIIYFGDILFPLGDIINRNYDLLKPGYVEEWWELELKKAAGKKFDLNKVNFEDAVRFSDEFKIPLHPEYIFYWTQIKFEQFLSLLDWISHSVIRQKIVLPYNKIDSERFAKGKRALEILGVEHKVTTENVVIDKKNSLALFANLGLDLSILESGEALIGKEIEEICKKIKFEEEVLDAINEISKYKIKDKAGDFIGARMGRPEKAKLRKLTGSPNVLFPVGGEGGRLRSFQEAVKVGRVKSDFPIYYCNKCKKGTIYPICEICQNRTKHLYYCRGCGENINSKICPVHKIGRDFRNTPIDITHYFKFAIKNLGISSFEVPGLIKGVRGTSNENHIPENLAKGFLRAIYDLQVNKDGTIRYDATELPLTHFKPKEVGTSIEKLKELGYLKDIHGKALENENQILEIMPHDIVLSSCPESNDEKGDDVFINISKFVDELLKRFYKLKAFYNINSKEDLIGHLVACMAPHNCACVIGRIIGFSKTQSLMASPYMHAAMRRDCDGDEAAVMLLLDMLINFSRSYLPSHRGGTQDAPLVLNTRIRAGEVDDQILDFELVSEYPLELYELAEQRKHSSEIKIEMVKQRLAEGKNPFTNIGFTHGTDNFNEGVVNSSYKGIPNMEGKVKRQMQLVEKLRAVDTSDVARLIIDRHFIRDLKGNLRKFSQQIFRCVKCNTKFRRPPLSGKCECGGRIIFTISHGSIIKYLEPALSLANNYDVSAYIKQDLELVKKYVESIFGRETEKQEALGKWV